MSSTVRKETAPLHQRLTTWTLRAALGLTAVGLGLVVAQIPYDQQTYHKNPSQEPTAEPTTPIIPSNISDYQPLESVLLYNLRPESVFMQDLPRGSHLERCRTGGGDEAYAFVNEPRLNVRSTPAKNAPIITWYGKGDIIPYRFRLIVLEENNLSRIVALPEHGKHFNSVTLAQKGTSYATNNPLTICEPISPNTAK